MGFNASLVFNVDLESHIAGIAYSFENTLYNSKLKASAPHPSKVLGVEVTLRYDSNGLG
jgi:hypothetical protein